MVESGFLAEHEFVFCQYNSRDICRPEPRGEKNMFFWAGDGEIFSDRAYCPHCLLTQPKVAQQLTNKRRVGYQQFEAMAATLSNPTKKVYTKCIPVYACDVLNFCISYMFGWIYLSYTLRHPYNIINHTLSLSLSCWHLVGPLWMVLQYQFCVALFISYIAIHKWCTKSLRPHKIEHEKPFNCSCIITMQYALCDSDVSEA